MLATIRMQRCALRSLSVLEAHRRRCSSNEKPARRAICFWLKVLHGTKPASAGPSLSLAWWLNYARAELKQARFIAKVDDDTYLHAPDLARLLRHIESTLGANSNVYLGALTFCHWYPKLFDMTQHALTLRGALNAGKWCRKNELAWVNPEQGGAGRCEGPFPSAPGYLIVLSSSLVGEISGGLHADADRLSQHESIRNAQSIGPAARADLRGCMVGQRPASLSRSALSTICCCRREALGCTWS